MTDETSATGNNIEPLDTALAEVVRRSGASAGGIYLLASDGTTLDLIVTCGIPTAFGAPWTGLALSTPMPAADAVRKQRLIWVGNQEQLAGSYPRAAIALPYRCALAAAPISDSRRSWGSLVLLWPAAHPAQLTSHERKHITFGCQQAARLLDETSPRTASADPPGKPRMLTTPEIHGQRSQPPLAAVDFAERLPGGSLSLDLEGRIRFVSSSSPDLLGRSCEQLLNTLPWQSLPWLNDPVYEDRHRAAVISRETTSFTALRPPRQWLEFRLHPDATGVSVRITPVDTISQDLPGPVPREQRPSRLARAGRLYQLMCLASALTETVSVQDVVNVVADQIMLACEAQGVVFCSAEAGRLRVVGHRGYTSEAIERFEDSPLTASPVGRALASGVPTFFSNPREMERIYPEDPSISGKQAWAFLPLLVSRSPIGCCTLSYDHPHTFDAEERAVLTSLAGLIAQAWDRARLYDAKHQLAHGLQQALLPRGLPAVSGLRTAARYLPATRGMDIGGDFYDLIRIDATTCAAVVGDVQGHNVAAAALMGQVRTAVHAHAATGAPPDEVLARSNRLITDLDGDLFVSSLYAQLDLDDHRVRMASAGHPPPLIRGPDLRTRILDVPPGVLLGIDSGATYPVTDVPLPPGTILAFYTDGLVETPEVDIDQCTAELAHHFAAAEDHELEDLCDTLLRLARESRRPLDDTVLFLLENTGQPV
ncbi:SpoIIE family protein phosphatase [Streptomyces sp. NPDC005146]